MNKEAIFRTLLIAAVLQSVVGCGAPRKVKTLRTKAPEINISFTRERDYVPEIPDSILAPKSDTIKVTGLYGEEMFLMNAIKDEDGDMVANEVLAAAVVTARFRNVAERHGEVDLIFDIQVPRMMLDGAWQTRFYPDMYIMGDSTRLDKVILTGMQYRKAQLKGYQQYNRYISRIVQDSTRFIDLRTLEAFLQRNVPQLYAFKDNDEYVTDDEFYSSFNVTEAEAIEHYTNKIARYLNNSMKRHSGAIYKRYVKVPIEKEGVRLDTVFTTVEDSVYVYTYTQTIKTRPGLRKADIVLRGEIYMQDQLLYTIPGCKPLSFYISSLSSFADNSEKYLTKVIERKAEANTACVIDFAIGKSEIRPEMGNNTAEIGRIKGMIRDILKDEAFDLDSITVTASASPEGSARANNALTKRRAESAAHYFSGFVKDVQDSLVATAETYVELDEYGAETGRTISSYNPKHISFKTRAGGENWRMLSSLIEKDSTISRQQKDRYYSELLLDGNLDSREMKMQKFPSYRHIRQDLYPRLRTVTFDFYMHRKGMVKDTIHTTELDTLYMRGVAALNDRDYDTACAILGPYNDYNAAVAYMSNDRNMTALEILAPMEKTARVNYLLAIIYSRQGRDQDAVQCYLLARQQDPSYTNRGNLDPEINVLIKRYKLNELDKDDMYDDLYY